MDEDDINEIEETFFHFRGEAGKQFHIKKAFIGLVFLLGLCVFLGFIQLLLFIYENIEKMLYY